MPAGVRPLFVDLNLCPIACFVSDHEPEFLVPAHSKIETHSLLLMSCRTVNETIAEATVLSTLSLY
jgi:hypothetical protein